MKKYLLLISITCVCLPSVLAQNSTKEAIQVLRKSAQKLQQLKVISYTYQREINNYKDNYFNQSKASCYIDFEKPAPANSFIFQFKTNDYIQIYNGSEYFTLDQTDKTIDIIEKPTAKDFSSLSLFYNSIPTLRNTLNMIADDDSVIKKISDTIIVNKKYKMISLGMSGKAIGYATGYRHFPVQLTTYYKILIDTRNGLPYQIIETNSEDKGQYNTRVMFLNLKTSLPGRTIGNKKTDFIQKTGSNKKTTFIQEVSSTHKARLNKKTVFTTETSLPGKRESNSKTNLSNTLYVKQPAKNSWYYSSWQPAYHSNKKAEIVSLISPGKQVNDWTLPVMGTSDYEKPSAKNIVKRDDFKGKVVVMYFWIKNCGACMESFPYLKALQKKYGSENFQLLSINSYDEKKEVAFFYKREKPAYMILYNGKKLARELGIYAYPSIVIIGKDGKVSDSQMGFNKLKTDQLIKEALDLQL